MWVRLLGPFQLEDSGKPITLSGARQRAVLADLLLHANEVVPKEQLLVDLWGEDSPPRAANALQAAISRLRKVLPKGRLISALPGYKVRIFPAELDVEQFEQLIFEGRDALAAGAAADAARVLDQARALWRGPPLADFCYEPFAQAEIARLEELRLTCLEERIEAHLALGPAGAFTAELRALVRQHPTRERFRGQLMLALYRSGRQAEALDVYRDFRATLQEELGLEPSSGLRDLEMTILRQAPVIAPGSPAAGAPTRRPVTVLCVVLQPISGSGTALDPEAHEVVYEQAAADLVPVIERYGGKLVRRVSEHLIGVFGVASLHEDDALRAARASVEAREALTTEADMLLSDHGANLVFRLGLATGEALVGGSGPLGFAGDVGNLAVTLAEDAGPGQILLSEQTQQLAAAAIEADSAGPGRFLLRSVHAGMRPLAVRLDAPFVNRDEELRRLGEAYARAARERTTVIVSVVGEAGLGKTRLVQESARRMSQEVTVLTGRCLPYGEGITFYPLRELVRQAGGGDDSPERIEDLLASAADAANVAERLHRAFGPGDRGRTDAAEIFWAARRFLEALARSRPLLVVFEDLHWAEPTFIDLVEFLALQPGQAPIALVCIARPELLEQRLAWAAEADRQVSIVLTPLGAGQAAELLDGLTAGQHISPSTRTRVIDTATGNPLYLEQLAASISEQAESEARLALPPTLQALLAARLQRLGPGASSVLARAAIAGKEFGEQEVSELLPPEARGPLGRNLRILIRRGLIQHGPGRVPGENYSFRHMLIQQATYDAIPKSLRAELHQRYADWLEFVFAEPILNRAEILGHHLEQSVRYANELWPADARSATLSIRAAKHLDMAGTAAHDRGDDLAAVNLLERAAALLPADDPALGRLYTTLGTALTEAGQLGQAKTTLDDAQRIAAANGDVSQHSHARVQALLLGLKLDPAEAAVEITRALPELRSEFDRSQDELGICRALQLEAALHWNLAQSAAAEEAWRSAARYARSVNDRRELAEILSWLASAALWGPTPAAEGIRQCEEYLDEIGNHPFGKADVLRHLAGLYAMQDDPAAARAALSRAKDLLDPLGATVTAAVNQPAALVAMLAGDLATAEAHLRLEYESLVGMGERRLLATTSAELARAIAAQGQHRYDEALDLLAVSREAAADEDRSAQAVGQGLTARILADRGHHREAEALARSAVVLAAQADLLSEHADTMLNLAHVLVAAGKLPGAQEAATQALGLYQSKGNLPGVRATLRCLADCTPS
jgi:DNA-binding SARP family transcriptional activator/tetratricopeptide (TPR) repeat protein